MNIVFKNKITGCAFSIYLDITSYDLEQLQGLFNLPGMDIDVMEEK